MSDKRSHKHMCVRIYGRVQNVGFRYGAAKCARKHEVLGFARNETDGSVYIEAEGDEEALRKLLDWCHRGPWLAKVERVEEEWGGPRKGFNGFLIA
jgi:acylphosphatase